MLSGPRRGSSLRCRSLRWHYPDSGSTGLISAAVSSSTPWRAVNIGRADGSGKPREKAIVVRLNFYFAPRRTRALDEIAADLRWFEIIPTLIVRERKILSCLDDPTVRGYLHFASEPRAVSRSWCCQSLSKRKFSTLRVP
jgi:hypothetical protein